MIKFKRLSDQAIIPTVATEGAAGFDLYASEQAMVGFGYHTMIKTDVAMEIPKGFVGLIKPRSGLAAKHSLDTMAGVIDSDFRDGVRVILTKEAKGECYEVKPGDRIAQIIFVPVLTDAIEVDELSDTERGAGGFGSTGK